MVEQANKTYAKNELHYFADGKVVVSYSDTSVVIQDQGKVVMVVDIPKGTNFEVLDNNEFNKKYPTDIEVDD